MVDPLHIDTRLRAEPAEAPPLVTISVILKADGQIVVSGPLQDKVACLGLLEMGKAIVLQAQAPEPPRVLPVRAVPGLKLG